MKRLLLAFLIFASPAWATHFVDNFQRPNGSLGANWTTVTANIPPTISSHGFTSGSGSSDNNGGTPSVNGGAALWNRGSFGTNQAAWITFSAVGATGTDCLPGPAVRMSTASGGSYYTVILGPNTTGGSPNYALELWKVVNGTGTFITAASSQTAHVGDKLLLWARSTTITVWYFNANSSTWSQVIAPQTDSSNASGQPGVVVFLGTPGIDHPANTTIAGTFEAWDSNEAANIVFNQKASDNFVRANENPLSGGGNWSTQTSGNIVPAKIVSNAVRATAIAKNGNGVFTGTPATADQYSETTVGASVNAGAFTGASVRATTSGQTLFELLEGGPIGSSALFLIAKFIAGAQTNLIVQTSQTIAIGDKLRLAVVGPTLYGYKNGVPISGMFWIDPTISSGGYGLVTQYGAAEADAQISNWTGGTAAYALSGSKVFGPTQTFGPTEIF